jgi:arylsulfatase A
LITSNIKTITRFLKEKGYKTAGIGKWDFGWGWATVDADDSLFDCSQKNKKRSKYS